MLDLLAIYVWMLDRRLPIGTNQAALVVGAIWATLTYNLADGRVWVLVPIWTTIAPATMRALQQPRTS